MGELVIKHGVERIERFQSLVSGEFWSALDDIPEEGIKAGETLLIVSLRYVEDELHTVILRSHPRVFGKTITIQVTDSQGKVHERGKTMTEHRFLTQDFLNRFQFQPEHKQIRAAELLHVQEEVARLQADLTGLVGNPKALRSFAIEQFEKEQSHPEPASMNGGALALTAQSQAIASIAVGSVQNALSSDLTEARIDEIRNAARQEGRINEIISRTISSRSNDITLAIQRMTPYFEEQGAAMIATSEASREHVKKIQDGVGSLELYIGKDVEVVTICEGESAPESIPLQIVQSKLMVDEELAVWADLDEWFDFSSMERFHQVLKSNTSLVEQIFPSERSIVCMATTRRYIDYRDPWENQARNSQNKVVFLLVRDGQNIYQVFSSVESHLGANQLFPSEREQQSHFRGMDGSTIKFEDVSYTDRLKAHDLMALHYRRFLILICGLDHRLKLFGSFYDKQTPYSFLSMEFQGQFMTFLHDNDGSGLLAAPELRPSLSEFIARSNSALQSGSRVLCAWNELISPQTAPGATQEDSAYSSYRGWSWKAKPLKDYEIVIASRQGEDVIANVSCRRYSTDKIISCKVNMSKYQVRETMGYLCMDTILPEDLEWYIRRRKFRSNHIFYIRMFKMALKFIHQERLEEHSYRMELNQALIDGHIGTPESRPGLIDKCIITFRAKNRGEPLSVAMGTQKGREGLLNQLFQLGGAAMARYPDVKYFLEQQGFRLIRLSVNATGKLLAYATPAAYECDNRLEAHAWVHKLQLASNTKGSIRQVSKDWVKMNNITPSENTLYEEPQLVAEWAGKKTAFASYQEKQSWFDLCSAGPEALQRFVGISDPDIFTEVMRQWFEAFEEINEETTAAEFPNLMIPVGVERVRGKAHLLYIGTKSPQDWLLHYAPNEELRKLFLEEYLSNFKYADEVEKKMLAKLEAGVPPVLGIYTKSEGEVQSALFDSNRKASYSLWSAGGAHEMPTMLNDQWSWLEANFSKNGQLYLTPAFIDDDGAIIIDEVIQNPRPQGLSPVTVWEFERDHFNKQPVDRDGKSVLLTHWFDISQEELTIQEVLGSICPTDFAVRTYRMDSEEQALRNIGRGTTRIRSSAENVEWHQPAPGVTRVIKRAW